MGIITVIGVGPGDPKLMTIAAIEAIDLADLVAYPIAHEGAESMAASIAKKFIGDKKRRLPLLFPMVADPVLRRTAWNFASNTLAAELDRGTRIALLCEGDASLYSTVSYIVIKLRESHPNYHISMIPGITSFSAVAASSLWPLAIQQDQLLIIPCPDSEHELDQELSTAFFKGRVLVLLKLGHRWTWVRNLLEHKGLLSNALFAEKIGWETQIVCSAESQPAYIPSYFSLLLIRQKWPHIMP